MRSIPGGLVAKNPIANTGDMGSEISPRQMDK